MNYLIKGARAPTTKRERTEDGFGQKHVPDGVLVGDILVDIDDTFIRSRLVPRALQSKGKRCVSGPVTVKVRNLRHEPGVSK